MNTLDNLRKTAKRWLKAIRTGDADAARRLRDAHPNAAEPPTLRDVQHALAREHGAESWIALKASLAARAPFVDTFLQSACWDHHIHGKADHRMYDRAAQRILARHPEIARHDLFTAIVCGELDEVARIVEERGEAAREAGGTRGWTPILYLAYTRFTHPKTIANALPIARLLLDHGANPNDFYPAGDVPYSVLTGIAGEGEQDSPRQPYAAELFDLALARGAAPFDTQVLYNTHFSGDMLWWLELVYAHTKDRAEWQDPEWRMFDMGPYGGGARFLLELAIKKNDLRLAEWALQRGANPNSAPATDRRFPKRSLYELAVLSGNEAMAELFARHGAAVTRPVPDEPAHSGPESMFDAARRDRPDELARLVENGMSVDVADDRNTRALHHAAYTNALGAAKFLIEHGAEIDPIETSYQSTPIGWATHADHAAMVELLAKHSRDVWRLCFNGYVARLAEVLRESPELAKSIDNDGATPLWWLPDDDAKAMQVVELLLAAGADPSHRSKSGKTAADWARRRGMFAIAARLGGPTETPAPPPASRGYTIDAATKTLRALRALSPREWDEALAAEEIEAIEANGFADDAVLERIAALTSIVALNLAHCAITDAGAAHLAACARLERVSLMGTATGDGAIAALAGNAHLHFFQAGDRVTDAGIARLRDIPRFATWHGGELEYALLSPHAGPTFLQLDPRAPFTSLAPLAELEGLAALSLFGGTEPRDLAPLAALPNLAWLGCTGALCDDAAMELIAAMPRLRMLMCQDTVATDDGFAALSHNASIEYLWGRRGHKLTARGFAALSAMPSLRGLAVSCMNLDDDALALLPRFRALRELVPIQVPDSGFRHIGGCERLEALWCMYCHDTGDTATEFIAGLRLRTYYAGQTRITDRSLELLGGMDSLERIVLANCAHVTDAGLSFLAKLPRLREVVLEGMPGVTAVFPPAVHVEQR